MRATVHNLTNAVGLISLAVGSMNYYSWDEGLMITGGVILLVNLITLGLVR